MERRTLLWLADRLPPWVTSDQLTAVALLAMIGVGASYWLAASSNAGLLLATFFLAVNWFGDSLDGTLARVRRQQRPRYGYYVDHVVDALGALALFTGLAASGYMTPAVAAAVVIAYFLVCVEVYLAACSLGRFQMSFFGFGPTELRILLAIGNVTLLVHPMATIGGQIYGLFDIGGIIATLGLSLTFLYSAIRNTRTLYRQEPLPARPASNETARDRKLS